MSIKTTIDADMKQYMRDKDIFALEAVRMLKSEIKNAEIEKKKELEDDEVIKVVQSAIKKNKDALESCVNAGRNDLADKERKYIDTLSKYMPAQLSEAEIVEIIKSVIAEQGGSANFGTVMKASMARVGSQADGKIVSAKVKELM